MRELDMPYLNAKQRDNSIDIAKGVGILLVVCCHANFIPLCPGRYFHMALFFFLSGWLTSYTQSWGKYIRNKILHLYVPFVCIELFFLLANPLFAGIGIAPHYVIRDYPLYLWHILCFDNIDIMLSPLWFLPTLFVASLISYAEIRVTRKQPILLLILSIFFLALGLTCTHFGWLQVPSINFKEALNVILVAQFFIVLGYVLKNISFHFDKWYIAILAVVYLYVIKIYPNLVIDMRINHYSSIFLWQLAVYAGIYATMYLSQKITTCLQIGRFLAYMGKYSIVILFGHIFFFKLIGWVQVQFFGFDANLLPQWSMFTSPWYWSILYSLVGLAAPLFLVFLFNLLRPSYNSLRHFDAPADRLV